MRRGARGRRLLAVVSVITMAAGGVFAWRHDRRVTGSYVTGFDLVGAGTAADLGRIRQQRRLVIGVGDGICIGSDERPPKERFERVELRGTRTQVVGSGRVQATRGEYCADVGQGFTTTVTLSRPIGRHALIAEDGSPHNWRFILIPPTDRATARRLVLPIRRDRRQPGPLIYTGPACNIVAKYLGDVPKRDWCLY